MFLQQKKCVAEKFLLFVLYILLGVASVFGQAPVITGFSPTSGPVGTLITVTGSYLNSPTAFTIGGVNAIVISDNGTTLVGLIMPTTITLPTSGQVSVTTVGGGPVNSSGNFTVTTDVIPSIAASSPANGKIISTTGGGIAENGAAEFGYSIALSADGLTALIGVPGNKPGSFTQGGAYVFVRSGATWSFQSILIGLGSNTGIKPTGANDNFGYSVALSADGNTAVIGSTLNSDSTLVTGSGAFWVFYRTPGTSTWTEQVGGAKGGVGYFTGTYGRIPLEGGGASNESPAYETFIINPNAEQLEYGGTPPTDTVITGYYFPGLTISAQIPTSISENASYPYPTTPMPQGASAPTLVWTWIQATGGSGHAGSYGANNPTAMEQYSYGPWFTNLVGTAYNLVAFTYPPIGQATPVYANNQTGGYVAISADGNTIAIGAPGYNSNAGAVYIWTRIDSFWTQSTNGPLLTGAANSYFGGNQSSGTVALSADGLTLLVGAYADSSVKGTATVWKRTSTSVNFSGSGTKLVANNRSAGFNQYGWAVALSADGNTALVSANRDEGAGTTSGYTGAAWLWTYSGSSWTQVTKFVGVTGPNIAGCTVGTGEVVDAVAPGSFGTSVALSADGNTVIIGGASDSSKAGALWVFANTGTFSSPSWSQHGSKITGGGEAGAGEFGFSVALSADGSTAMAGGYNDSSSTGAAWVFTTAASTIPVANFIASDTIICAGSTVNFTDQSAGLPDSWNWAFAGGTPGNSTSQNPVVTYNDTGTFAVKLVAGNSLGADSITKTSYITVVANAVTGTISTFPDSVCAGNSSQLTVTGSSGSLQWQSSLTGSDFTNTVGADSSHYVTPLLSQTTYYRFIAMNGICADTSGAIPVEVNPNPVPPVLSTNDSAICSSDSTLINSSGTYSSYLWNDGDTTDYTYAKQAGGYWVTVTNADGCTVVSDANTPPLTITVYPVPSVSIIAQGDTLSSFGAVSYQWFFDDTIIPGATSAVYVAHKSGNYAVQVTDTNGCTAVSNYTQITVTGILEPDAGAVLNIYPNPFTNTIIVSTRNTGIARAEVYDALGRMVFNKTNENPYSTMLTTDVSILPPGAYYMVVKTTGSEIYYRQMIKL